MQPLWTHLPALRPPRALGQPAIDTGDGCRAGNPAYLRGVFEGWAPDIHDIIRATRNDEIEQRDLYDRPPSINKPWTEGRVALLGDAIHAMMPNLGQGGCQAIEDAQGEF